MYRDTEKPIRQIARELGVDALIQLAVGREADSVVVDVGVVDGTTELLIWTHSLSREVEGVLGLYREVSRMIADEIGVALSGDAEARLAQRPAVDPQLYDAYVTGLFHLRRFNPQDFALALQHFERALAIDSLYAPAHLGVASVWGYRAQAGLVLPEEARPILNEYLDEALRLDPQLPRARFLQGSKMVWLDWDVEAGEVAMRRALELDPNDAEAQVFYGHVQAILGRWDEAARRGELAMEIDPLNPFVGGLYGALLTMIGRSEEAIAVIQGVLERNPGAGFGVTPLVQALHVEGRYEEELELQRSTFEARRDEEVVEALNRSLQEGGFEGAWKGAADALAARGPRPGTSPMLVARLYLRGGEPEKAMEWLEQAVELGNPGVPYLGVVPDFWDLHDHPRFQALMRDLGLVLLKPEGEG
jgi:tetratricopeptide (TPR) repeat protein